MVWLRVQRSGRTSIRATTRSLSASVNVTPFNSANGIFIEFTFSSGVIVGDPPFFQSSYAAVARVSIELRQKVCEMMDCGVKPGNDVSGSSRRDNDHIIRHTFRHAP